MALSGLRDDLSALALEPYSVVVFGSLALGTWRAATSDINVALVLSRADAVTLRRLGPALGRARKAARVTPIIFERGELPDMADAFAVKLAHIRAHHVVIIGADPFADLRIDPEHLRVRIEQELRNQLVRLRRKISELGHDALGAARIVLAAVTPLAIELEAALALTRQRRPDEGGLPVLTRQRRPDDVGPPVQPDENEAGLRATFEAAARRFDLDAPLLMRLADLREAVTRDAAPDAIDMIDRLLGVLERAADFVHRWQPARGNTT